MHSSIPGSIGAVSDRGAGEPEFRYLCPGLGFRPVEEEELPPLRMQFWKHFLTSSVKVGAEIEVAVPRGSNREKFHHQLLQIFKPSHDYNKVGRYGIYGVEVEHCGVEIQVIGSPPYYPSLLKQYQRIAEVLFRLRARTKATCGLHFHFLCEPLMRPIPQIILANLWNITRFFAPELKFLTSAGERPRGICRRRNHNSHLEMVKWEAGSLSLAEIQKHLRESEQVPEHQNFFNLEHLVFGPDGGITNLHYEFRFPDADLCATSIVAKIFLCMALLFRAVEISMFGILMVEDQGLWERKVLLLNRLSNNDGTLAESDTSSLREEDYQTLKQGSRDLIRFLRPSLLSFPDNPSVNVLEFLLQHPISSLRGRGWTWEDISTVLSWIGRINSKDVNDRLLLEKMIEVNELCGLSSPFVWKHIAATLLGTSCSHIERVLFQMDRERGLLWDERLGGFFFRR